MEVLALALLLLQLVMVVLVLVLAGRIRLPSLVRQKVVVAVPYYQSSRPLFCDM
jgi:hypothetical protein